MAEDLVDISNLLEFTGFMRNIKGIPPMKLDTLKEKNGLLYDKLYSMTNRVPKVSRIHPQVTGNITSDS